MPIKKWKLEGVRDLGFFAFAARFSQEGEADDLTIRIAAADVDQATDIAELKVNEFNEIEARKP